MRDYFDNRWHRIMIGPEDYVTVPTGIANFASQFVFEGRPPPEWFKRLYNVQRFTDMPIGGHFGSAEEPEALSRDIIDLFAGLQGSK